ncbi:MAG: ligase-associated DNA damage response exonuclease [Caldilineaceae bacterium]|nr:ligase-associated DNA damage response exonuclease [Caldilineaceae bacterium]
MADALLQVTERGLYCAAGDFYIDPWQPVTRAVITHAHADHARPGSKRYLTSPTGAAMLRLRVDSYARIVAQPFGESLHVNGVRVSLHPAGHLLGSAQVRVEHQGEVWVVSGDYKTEVDATCEPFELVPCHTFITESTFGLPIYRWRPQSEIFTDINQWWQQNQAQGRTSILFAYALGKAQRVLAGVDATLGPILIHGAVHRFVHAYRNAGIVQPTTLYADSDAARRYRGEALVIAPPSAAGSSGWLRKFGPTSLAFASGWMRIRGARRRRAVDRGFVLSDHADWDGLLTTIRATGAERIGVTHGYTSTLVRYLVEQSMDAFVMLTRYEGETSGDAIDNEDAAQDASGITGDETMADNAMISDASASSFGHDEE